jgi:hypothetical protein
LICSAVAENGEELTKNQRTTGPTTTEENNMSTHFRLSKKVSARDLFGGELEKFGVREHVKPDDTSERSRCLTDGNNYLWVFIADGEFVSSLKRYGMNAPGKILSAIAEAFETDIFSEHEPQYWGFDTQEAWDAEMEKMADQSQQEFYVDLCAYVRGEPNNIGPRTIGEIKAKIAKKLVEEDATILENKDRLFAEIDATYDRDHAVKVTLGPEDLALAKMMATHEDDLPQA